MSDNYEKKLVPSVIFSKGQNEDEKRLKEKYLIEILKILDLIENI